VTKEEIFPVSSFLLKAAMLDISKAQSDFDGTFAS